MWLAAVELARRNALRSNDLLGLVEPNSRSLFKLVVCKLPKTGPIGTDGENLAIRLMIQSNCSLILKAHPRTGEDDLVSVRRPARMRVARRVGQPVEPTPIGPDK